MHIYLVRLVFGPATGLTVRGVGLQGCLLECS